MYELFEYDIFESEYHRKVLEGNACDIPVEEIARMPVNSGLLYGVKTVDRESGRETTSPIALTRTKGRQHNPDQYYLDEVVRILPQDDIRYLLEAYTFDLGVMKEMFADQLARIQDGETLLGFNVKAKVGGKHHPAIRADRFIPWAVELFSRWKPVNFILADFESGTDTYHEFMNAYHLPANPKSADVISAKVEAMKTTWAHRQFSKAGFGLIPGESTMFNFNSRTPNAPPFVTSLYSPV